MLTKHYDYPEDVPVAPELPQGRESLKQIVTEFLPPSSLLSNHHARRGESPCVPKLGELPVEQEIAFARQLWVVVQEGQRSLALTLG